MARRLPLKPLVPAALAACVCVAGAASHARAANSLKLVQVASFAEPTSLASPPGDRRRVFVTERSGRVRLILDGRVRNTPFLDLRRLVKDQWEEQGLLSLAFAPDYRRSGRFYVYYTGTGGSSPGGDLRVEEFRRSRANPDVAAPRSRRVVLVQRKRRFWDHNGGQLQFGPDGLLYIGLGDGGHHTTQENYVHADPSRHGLDLGTLFGKLLRIDPRPQGRRAYRIPRDNPFVGRAGARGEIFSYGLRNPWRFSFDGDHVAIGDVGESSWEEVEFLTLRRARGASFGWSALEGPAAFNPDQHAGHAIAPTIAYPHPTDNCAAVVGGYVARDHAVPALYGRYVYGDYCLAALFTFSPSAPRRTNREIAGLIVPALTSFGKDGRGRLYAISRAGPVYRFAAG